MKKNGFQQLLCMEHLSAICSKETYLTEFVSLAKNLGADYKRIIQVSKLLSRKGHSYSYDDTQLYTCNTDDSITCNYICEKYKLQDVCKACKDSPTYSLVNYTFEKKLLAYCIADISNLAKIDTFINGFTLSKDSLNILFSSYINLDPSCETILYKPLNYHIYTYLHSLSEYPSDFSDLKNNFIGYLPTCFQIINNWFIDIVEKYLSSLFEISQTNKEEGNYQSEETYTNLCESIYELLTPYIIEQPKEINSEPGLDATYVDSKDNDGETEVTSTLSSTTTEPTSPLNLANDDKRTNNNTKKINKPSTPVSEQVNSLLRPDGYLKNTLTSNAFSSITIVNTEDCVSQLDYDVLKTDILSVEYVVYNKNSGLLFYIPTSNTYYFVDLKNTSVLVPAIIPILKYYFCEEQAKIKLSLFTEPLYKYLDMFDIKTNTKLYSIISYNYVSNPDMQFNNLYDILAKGTQIRINSDSPLLLQIMPYYIPVYKKYIKRLTLHQFTLLHQLSEVSHILSRTLYLDKYYPFKDKYLTRDLLSYKFAYEKITPLFSKKKTPAVLLSVYIDVNEECQYSPQLLFQQLCVKLFEGRFFYKYDIVVLNMDVNSFVLYIPSTAYRIVYTAINRWLSMLNDELYNGQAIASIVTEDISIISQNKEDNIAK